MIERVLQAGGVLLGGLVGLVTAMATGSWLLLAPALAGGWLLAVVITWSLVRAVIRQRFAGELSLSWADGPARPYQGEAAEFDRSLQELGYEPAGFLARADHPVSHAAVYIHRELPIYALMGLGDERSPGAVTFLQLDSFMEGGGRLTTTSDPVLARVFAFAGLEGPRLAQLRPRGKPLALDGQHAGTLKAWTAGKRRALPATPEDLLHRIREDRSRLQERLRALGWLPFPIYLRCQFGEPPGVLTF